MAKINVKDCRCPDCEYDAMLAAAANISRNVREGRYAGTLGKKYKKTKGARHFRTGSFPLCWRFKGIADTPRQSVLFARIEDAYWDC